MPVERVSPRWSGRERHRWETFTPERTVLAIARTFTSTVRLLDALSAFCGDFRVEVLFTFDDSSAFHEGVPDVLRDAGVRVIPWAEIEQFSYDLALTASENVDLESVDAPIIVLPHGIGFHKYVPDSAGHAERVSGVVPAGYLRDKHVWMVISHPEQREHLRPAYPDAAERCLVVGDPTYDRLIASLPLRDHYRSRLGLKPGQRLVVITSTWRGDSLLGSWKELPARLLGELPADEYRVAVVMHPNIGSWHGAFHTGQGFADAYAAGLLRIPPAGGWQAALIAADIVIGDHGSVTLYGAALDRPVLLASTGTTTVAGTPPEDLGRVADRLVAELPLREQIDREIDAHRPGRFAGITERMFARPGEAVQVLRELLYGKLVLSVPKRPATLRAVPDPRPEVDEPRSFVVYSRMRSHGRVELWRFPASVDNVGVPGSEVLRHLSVGEDEPDRRLPENASLIVRRRLAEADDAEAWIVATLNHFPGALVVAVALDDGCLAGLRNGTRVLATGPQGDAALAASAIYTCVRAGTLANGLITLHHGTAETTFALNVRPPG
jgi:CDP-Glycerol:Poly(glycerophosphate) glycerophosphotransferase